MTGLLRCVLALAALVLAACAAPTPKPTTGDWSQQQSTLHSLTHFSASGKIALRTAEQAENGSLLWQQMGDATHIRLSGPMGLAATTVDSDGRVLEVRQGEEYSRWDLEDAELRGQRTWDLPLRAMVHWLKGVPAPGLPVENLELDALAGLPRQFTQDGWVVSYKRFDDFDGFTLPTRIDASRDSTSARIILRQWKDLAAE